MGANLLPFFLDLNESTFFIFLNRSFLFPPRAVLRLRPEMVWQVAPRIDAQVATGNSMPSTTELSCVRYQNEMRSRLLSDPLRRGVHTQQGIDLVKVPRFSCLKLHSFIWVNLKLQRKEFGFPLCFMSICLGRHEGVGPG